MGATKVLNIHYFWTLSPTMVEGGMGGFGGGGGRVSLNQLLTNFKKNVGSQNIWMSAALRKTSKAKIILQTIK